MVVLNGAVFLLVCAASLAAAAGDGESLEARMLSLLLMLIT
jgi:hypothetical protein